MRHVPIFCQRILVVVVAAAICLAACSAPKDDTTATEKPNPDDSTVIEPIDDNTTDQMWSEDDVAARLDIVVCDEQAFLVPSGERLDQYLGEVEDAKFYRAIADVSYLYGGIAGYDGYPEIHSVSSLEEISPTELNIPSVTQSTWGVVSLKGYVDADYMLNVRSAMAVMKDGAWTYRYDKDYKRDDGSWVCHRDGVDEEKIEEGIAQGVLCCEDYILLPVPSETSSGAASEASSDTAPEASEATSDTASEDSSDV